jgi:hypothetical protein
LRRLLGETGASTSLLNDPCGTRLKNSQSGFF